MRLLVFLAVGGAAGTLARYLLGGLVQPASGTFPLGTLVVNVVGAFLLGFAVRYLLGTGIATPELRAAVTIGFCGSFTTMSTFSYETLTLLVDGAYWRATAYVGGSLAGSLVAAFGGMQLAGRLL